MANYAYDTKHYVYGENISSNIESLEKASDLLFQWLSDNNIKANESKCHILLSTNENLLVNIRTAQIQNNSPKKLLGVKMDCKPTEFKDHIGSICKDASTILHDLIRVSGCINPDEDFFI